MPSALPGDADPGGAELLRHRRAQLPHRHGDGVDARVGLQQGGAQVLGQRLEEGVARGRDHPLGHLAQRAVVGGVAEGVASSGGAQVDVQVEVELEELRLRLLVRQHTDDARQPQAPELDDVVAGGHALLRSRADGRGDQPARCRSAIH